MYAYFLFFGKDGTLGSELKKIAIIQVVVQLWLQKVCRKIVFTPLLLLVAE